MLTLRPIPQGADIGLNPYLSETAVLLDRSYSRFAAAMRHREFPADPVGPWSVRGEMWSNVQLMIAERALGSLDLQRFDEAGLLSGRILALLIPGTNELGDWTSGNFNPWPVEIGGIPGRWRRGFQLAGEWAWSRLRAAYQPGDLLLIAGHSYGAAAATVAAAYAIRDGYRGSILGVSAFAAPRTTTAGGKRFLLDVYGKTIGQRITLGFDAVPHAIPGVFWRHGFEGIYVGSDGVCRSRFGLLREVGAELRGRGVQAIADHAMRRYLAWTLAAAPAPFGPEHLALLEG